MSEPHREVHEDDSYGQCVSCRIIDLTGPLDPHDDDFVTLTVPFPCAVVREADAIAIGVQQERERLHKAVVTEYQFTLEEGHVATCGVLAFDSMVSDAPECTCDANEFWDQVLLADPEDSDD